MARPRRPVASFSQSERLRRRQKTPTVLLAPADAAARGIGDGDAVVVTSARGAARFAAELTDRTRPGVVVVEGLWWHRFHPGGHGANVLTRDDVTDLGGGPAFHSNLVQVARAESAPAGSALAGVGLTGVSGGG